MPNRDDSKDTKKILNELNLGDTSNRKDIVYGVYDNSDDTLFSRINDFFIDNHNVSLKEKSYFFHLLAVMLDAGMSILEALKTLSKKFENERLRRIINTLAYNVEKGKTLSAAMENFPEVFDDSEIGIVKSGESVGHLDRMLFKLSSQLERSYGMGLKLRSALVYPATVLIALFLSGGVIVLFVLPKLLKFFSESGHALPFLTRCLLWISDFLTNYWIAVVIVSIGLVIAFNAYRSSVMGRFKLDYLKLKLPVIGELFRHSEIVRFVSLLGILVESGLPITKSLKILSESMKNVLYSEKISDVQMSVERGEKISSSLEDAPLLFPSTVTQMIAIGEKSATLASICEKIGSQYEKELDHSIKNLMTILEPLVILFVGILVAIMAYAILGPIFQLSQFV
ncbi:MAG: type II secretion system F family protein [Candidatus Peregrinibacteria bacterium]|nr:type II secretion system F family protein [Candidatus Peregrinibacteria bacterium]MDZ4244548.1 type II secretion system F family protein [Candidatus Gracilibacteria bacterium]